MCIFSFIPLLKCLIPFWCHDLCLFWTPLWPWTHGIVGKLWKVYFNFPSAKSRTRLSDFLFNFHFHALEKEMATHFSVLAWRIPGMGEPHVLPSMGSHRVGHDWNDLAAAAAAAAAKGLKWEWIGLIFIKILRRVPDNWKYQVHIC